MKINCLGNFAAIEVRQVTTTVPTSLTKFVLQFSLDPIHASLHAGSADVPVRIEREARRSVKVKNFAWSVVIADDLVAATCVRASRSLRTGTSALPAMTSSQHLVARYRVEEQWISCQ